MASMVASPLSRWAGFKAPLPRPGGVRSHASGQAEEGSAVPVISFFRLQDLARVHIGAHVETNRLNV